MLGKRVLHKDMEGINGYAAKRLREMASSMGELAKSFGKASLEEKDLEYRVKEQNLEKILAEEEARAAQLEEYRIYVQTKQYVEKVAKEKLGLVKKDEILLKPKENK